MGFLPRSPKTVVVLGWVFSLSSLGIWRTGFPLLSFVIRSKRLPPGELVPELEPPPGVPPNVEGKTVNGVVDAVFLADAIPAPVSSSGV